MWPGRSFPARGLVSLEPPASPFLVCVRLRGAPDRLPPCPPPQRHTCGSQPASQVDRLCLLYKLCPESVGEWRQGGEECAGWASVGRRCFSDFPSAAKSGIWGAAGKRAWSSRGPAGGRNYCLRRCGCGSVPLRPSDGAATAFHSSQAAPGSCPGADGDMGESPILG